MNFYWLLIHCCHISNIKSLSYSYILYNTLNFQTILTLGNHNSNLTFNQTLFFLQCEHQHLYVIVDKHEKIMIMHLMFTMYMYVNLKNVPFLPFFLKEQSIFKKKIKH